MLYVTKTNRKQIDNTIIEQLLGLVSKRYLITVICRLILIFTQSTITFYDVINLEGTGNE